MIEVSLVLAKLGGKPAETLDEYERQMLEYQKLYPNKTPLGMAHSTAVHAGDYQMLGQLWQDSIWKKEGETYLPDLKGEGLKQYLDLIVSDPAGKTAGIDEQTERVLFNLKAVLEAGEASLGSVVKTTVYLELMDDLSRVNEVYGRFFGENPPRGTPNAVLAS